MFGFKERNMKRIRSSSRRRDASLFRSTSTRGLFVKEQSTTYSQFTEKDPEEDKKLKLTKIQLLVLPEAKSLDLSSLSLDLPNLCKRPSSAPELSKTLPRLLEVLRWVANEPDRRRGEVGCEEGHREIDGVEIRRGGGGGGGL